MSRELLTYPPSKGVWCEGSKDISREVTPHDDVAKGRQGGVNSGSLFEASTAGDVGNVCNSRSEPVRNGGLDYLHLSSPKIKAKPFALTTVLGHDVYKHDVCILCSIYSTI
jgi:hypothetical protein